ncbi:ABC transporter ATP-binding protein [Azospirillum sp. TSH64]|uniref:ABC transporter ATP-binding protein n=1 Tax=Azospirillum sp. TSH64 TaxID=652740 RepID=UPI000D6098EE|nr:ABC transporter ATP-binding protein [Azospirillum sp. TSH64]PWC76390.1 macrolide ABC transporter ATP-binding protein [Azospirillum sp. TSH64]
MLDLTGVHKTYGTGAARVPVLRDVSLAIRAGEVCAITGSSGSGKSTLLNLLGLLDRPDAGRVLFDGEDLGATSVDRRARLRNRCIGFVFQSFHLLPRLSALDNVALPFLYRGLSPRSCRDRAMAALERVGLADRAHHRPDAMSGGQRQRVAVARAIVGKPRLLLADEPTGNLDSESARRIIDLFAALNADTGVTIVVVTHDPAIAARCPRRILMRDGRVAAPEDAASRTPSA